MEKIGLKRNSMLHKYGANKKLYILDIYKSHPISHFHKIKTLTDFHFITIF